MSEQLTSKSLITNIHATHNIGTAGGPRRLVLTETPHSPSKQLQDDRAHISEKLLNDIEHVQSGGHVKYLETEFSQQKQQMQLADQRFEEIEEDVFSQRSPNPAFGSIEKIPFTDVRSLVPYIHSMCPNECQCACHGSQSHGSWSVSWLNRVLGSVLVSYYGMPLWKTACTEVKCRTSRTKRLQWIRAAYTVPPWLSQITLFAFVSLRPPAPELLLRVINRFPTMSSTDGLWNLISIIERRDIESLKFSIANRLASVHDVHHATGQTALHFAIRQESFEMVKILLHAGADPFQGPVSSSAATALLARIHKGSPQIKQVSSLFSVTEIMETYEYTDLHKIILGIQPLELSEAFARSQVLASQVNTPTVAGLTPAHVAAIRGGVAHLAALKNAGADLSLPTLDKKTPLHLACTYKKASAARFILDTEQVADQTTATGMTPLHCIVTERIIDDEMWHVADRLLELGADINACATCDVPPLMYAANAGSPEAIEYLLSHGANIDARDIDGDTALVEATFTNSPDCVRVLLQRGADIKSVNKYGRGPLQYLAGTGSEAVIDVFKSTGAFTRGNVDKHALDNDGLNALDIFNRRPSPSTELREKFQRLFDSIPDYMGSDLNEEDGKHPSSSSDTSSSEDEYFDAAWDS